MSAAMPSKRKPASPRAEFQPASKPAMRRARAQPAPRLPVNWQEPAAADDADRTRDNQRGPFPGDRAG